MLWKNDRSINDVTIYGIRDLSHGTRVKQFVVSLPVWNESGHRIGYDVADVCLHQ